jgi:hypothetical protein
MLCSGAAGLEFTLTGHIVKTKFIGFLGFLGQVQCYTIYISGLILRLMECHVRFFYDVEQRKRERKRDR